MYGTSFCGLLRNAAMRFNETFCDNMDQNLLGLQYRGKQL